MAMMSSGECQCVHCVSGVTDRPCTTGELGGFVVLDMVWRGVVSDACQVLERGWHAEAELRRIAGRSVGRSFIIVPSSADMV